MIKTISRITNCIRDNINMEENEEKTSISIGKFSLLIRFAFETNMSRIEVPLEKKVHAIKPVIK